MEWLGSTADTCASALRFPPRPQHVMLFRQLHTEASALAPCVSAAGEVERPPLPSARLLSLEVGPGAAVE